MTKLPNAVHAMHPNRSNLPIHQSETVSLPGQERLHTESGAALLVMLLLLIVGGAALFIQNVTGRTAAGQHIVGHATVLATAKTALLAYAVTRYDLGQGIGLLPCPDTGTGGGFAEGEAHSTNCGAQYASVLGRLPWKTLGLPPSRGEIGECLWYAVSGVHKDAPSARSELLNTDSAGFFEAYAQDGVTPIAGTNPADRAVAVLLAPGNALPSQTRGNLGLGVEHCAGSYNIPMYLDDNGTIDNAVVSGTPDTIDQFINGGPMGNDQMLVITRSELAAAISARTDLATGLQNLAAAAAACTADYGRKNPGGPTDQRLPWPAPVTLSNYRSSALYGDTATGVLSGRLPDNVNDSNGQTGNTIARVLSDCDSVAVPAWTPAVAALWQDWKDHFFYVVADDFRPDAPVPTSCVNCLTVNGGGPWSAVVMFSGSRLPALGQVRDEPPTDPDTKGVIGNYLEGRNASNHPLFAGTADFESTAAGPAFNDVLYCLDTNLGVSAC